MRVLRGGWQSDVADVADVAATAFAADDLVNGTFELAAGAW